MFNCFAFFHVCGLQAFLAIYTQMLTVALAPAAHF